ncbi:MAG: hypothetical protein NT080_06415 [Spirochaetes bacterium]|nr:hypothetical protein [Spirochaetota bacterium]
MTTGIFKSEAAELRVMEAYGSIRSRWPVCREDLVLETGLGPTFVAASGNPGAVGKASGTPTTKARREHEEREGSEGHEASVKWPWLRSSSNAEKGRSSARHAPA